MATSLKRSTPHSDAKRRTLRSNSKPTSSNNNPSSSPTSDSLIKQIKLQIEHQDTNNATKTSFPIENDLRSFESIIHPQESPIVSIHNQLQQNSQFQSFSNDISAHNISSLPLSINENYRDKKTPPSNPLEKKETCFETPVTKSSSKTFKWTENSPYESKRRSYRKIKKQNVKCIPFRKCQDQLEIRIVGLINKIFQGKQSSKEIEIFCDKIAKISLKDLYNPYVVSGIETIRKLIEKNPPQTYVKFELMKGECILRLKNEVKKMSDRIWQEFGNIEDYTEVIEVKKLINLQLVREKVVRKVYKMLIHQKKVEPVVARVRSLEVCDSFFTQCNNQTSQADLIYFLKQQNFLSI